MNPVAIDPVSARATLILCCLVALCEGIDLQAAGVAAAGIVPAFHPSSAQLGVFFSGGTLGLFVGALIGGRLADSIGRKPVLVASVLLFAVFSLLTPLASDMTSLSALRVLTGFGLGGAFPNLIALVSESASENRRSASVAAAYSAAPFGGAVVSLISYALGPQHWQWIFIIGGILPAVLAPVIARMLPESPAFVQVRVSLRSNSTPGPVATSRPGDFRALFTEGRALRTTLLWASFFLGLLTLFLLLNWLPTLLQSAGFTKPQVAGAQIGFNLGGSLAALLVGRLLEGRTRRLTIFAIFTALPVFLYLLATVPTHFFALLSIVFLLGCAVLAGQAFFYATAPANYPTRNRGIGVGAAIAMGRLGSVAGPLLGGVLTASGKNSSQLLMSLLPLAIAGSVLAVLLAWRMDARSAVEG
ncbi:MAG: MFS transporter [Steroidobacteraceae bacterium]